MDGESGESDVTGVERGQSDLERLGWGWRSETGSWLQRQREAYRK